MNNLKIKLNDSIRNSIRVGRDSKSLSVKELSERIGRTSSYISALENKHVLNVKTDELISIFKLLFDLTEEQAADKIKTLLLIEDTEGVYNEATESDVDIDIENLIDTEEVNIRNYTTNDKFNSDKKFKKFVSLLNEILRLYHDKSPENAERMIQMCIRSFRFDIGFMSAIMSLPYFTLESLSYEQRQAAFDDITSAFHKHYLLARANIDSTKKE